MVIQSYFSNRENVHNSLSIQLINIKSIKHGSEKNNDSGILVEKKETQLEKLELKFLLFFISNVFTIELIIKILSKNLYGFISHLKIKLKKKSV